MLGDIRKPGGISKCKRNNVGEDKEVEEGPVKIMVCAMRDQMNQVMEGLIQVVGAVSNAFRTNQDDRFNYNYNDNNRNSRYASNNRFSQGLNNKTPVLNSFSSRGGRC